MKKRVAPPPPAVNQSNGTNGSQGHSRTPSDPGLSPATSGHVHRRNHSTDLVSSSGGVISNMVGIMSSSSSSSEGGTPVTGNISRAHSLSQPHAEMNGSLLRSQVPHGVPLAGAKLVLPKPVEFPVLKR